MKNHERYLTKRDRRILDFVARYRAGNADMLEHLYFNGNDTRANVTRVLRRLVRRGLLRKVSYGTGLSYFVLTRRGHQVLGLPPRTPRPLTEQSLPVVLAIAAYCVRMGLRRLTNREFIDLYPELWRPGLRSSNYFLVDTPGGLKLGMFLVDRGGTARRIRSKVRRVIRQRDGLPDFLSLIEAGRFRITVLTGLPQQQEKILRHIQRESFEPVEVVAELVPELGGLLTLGR